MTLEQAFFFHAFSEYRVAKILWYLEFFHEILEFLWNFLEFFHKLLEFLQNFKDFFRKSCKTLAEFKLYCTYSSKKNNIPPKNVVFKTYMAKNLCFYWVFGWDLLKLLWLLEFLAEKVLEFFHGLSFFRLEFFGYREKKKPDLWLNNIGYLNGKYETYIGWPK